MKQTSQTIHTEATGELSAADDAGQSDTVGGRGAEAAPSQSPSPDAAWHFLSLCKPPLTHLYAAFLVYGLDTIGDGFLDTLKAGPVSKVESFVNGLRESTGGVMNRFQGQVIIYHLTKGDGEAA